MCLQSGSYGDAEQCRDADEFKLMNTGAKVQFIEHWQEEIEQEVH